MSNEISVEQLHEIIKDLTARLVELEKESFYKKWNDKIEKTRSKEK